jgi:hypothetical protein
MRKVMKSFMALSLGLSLVLAGCSKDEDENYAKEIAGKYVGTISMGGDQVASNVEINVVAKNGTTATLSLNTTIPQALQGNDLLLDVSCETAVSKLGNDYTVTGNTTVSILGYETPLPVTIDGLISSAGRADLAISIVMAPPPAEPVSAVFSGTKQ